MIAEDGSPRPILAYAGLGGAVVCCLGIELLGGVVIFSGLAATIGFSTGLTYLVIAGGGGVLAALLAVGFRRVRDATHA